jgi:hypothetical protein
VLAVVITICIMKRTQTNSNANAVEMNNV